MFIKQNNFASNVKKMWYFEHAREQFFTTKITTIGASLSIKLGSIRALTNVLVDYIT